MRPRGEAPQPTREVPPTAAPAGCLGSLLPWSESLAPRPLRLEEARAAATGAGSDMSARRHGLGLLEDRLVALPVVGAFQA